MNPSPLPIPIIPSWKETFCPHLMLTYLLPYPAPGPTTLYFLLLWVCSLSGPHRSGIKQELSFCNWLCVHMQYMCANVRVYLCLETGDWLQVYSSFTLHFGFLRQCFSLNLELTVRIDWVAINSSLPSKWWVYRGICHAQLFTWRLNCNPGPHAWLTNTLPMKYISKVPHGLELTICS